MKLVQVNVGSLGGLHHELYHPDTDNLFIKKLSSEHNDALLDANALFWGEHFDPQRVLALSKNLSQCIGGFRRIYPGYKAIASDPELFVSQVQEASLNLCDQSIGVKRFYRYVETLMLLCQLYSDLEYKPHLLTLYEGFTLFELSSLSIYENCLKPSENPYLPFINRHCMPIISEIKPDLIWLNGRITMPNMAIARLSKSLFPNVHISVTNYSSEYYSLNKITKHLLQNKPLFSMIDSIILDDSEVTRQTLIETLSKGIDLSLVPNLLYADKSKPTMKISQSLFKYQPAHGALSDAAITRPVCKRINMGIDPNSIADIRLFPNHACYWNKCTFCGINKKYAGRFIDDSDSIWDVTEQVEAFRILAGRGHSYIWAIDEAIPAKTLRALAEDLIKESITINWQVRSRFHEDFFEDRTIELLAESGLKEIRFGLESASPRILRLMNKFPDSVTLGLIKKIVKEFDKNGISVHCPVIIGYPTETEDERQFTYEFLKELSVKNKKFSFNINIFSLDIQSPLFNNWEFNGISSVRYSCHPDYFIGNLLDWECQLAPFERGRLEKERNSMMRRYLYPWIPATSLTLPHIFYRLCETIRNTLIFKAFPESDKQPDLFNPDQQFYGPGHVVLTPPSEFGNTCLYQLYNWHDHTHIEIDERTAFLWKNLGEPWSNDQRTLDKIGLKMINVADLLKILFNNGFIEQAV